MPLNAALRRARDSSGPDFPPPDLITIGIALMKRKKGLSAWFKTAPGARIIQRHNFTETHFEPYVKSIGSLLLAWNDLHERLSTLFVMAMGIGQFSRSFALWHQTRNDLGKRMLLKAAIENLPASEIGTRTKLVEEITWILDIAKELEGFRDDSAHTPLHYDFPNLFSLAEMIAAQSALDFGTPSVMPHTGFANPRALRIEKKKRNMLVEYRYARSRILILRDYAIAIDHAWFNAPAPWPDRPELPDRTPSRKSKSKAAPKTQK
jgi:hypothetical protein